MAHPLDPGSTSPAPPNPNPGQNQSVNALMMPGVMPRRRMPAPSHTETVGALRHFMAIVDELQVLEKNPALGRTDCKAAMIDGVTKLVSERMISPANAVSQLANIPSDPLAQRKWVKQMLQQTIAAQNNVLDHHIAGHAPTLDWKTESQHPPYNPDDHLETMSGLMGHYRPVA
jgi:hypothetical protein